MTAHYDQIINYLTCDGTPWTARWQGSNFIHTNNQGESHSDSIMNYLTLDNVCWQVRWDQQNRRFIHKLLPNGPTHTDTIINYLTHDRTKWTATRYEDGFVHASIGPADDQRSISFLDKLRLLVVGGSRESQAIQALILAIIASMNQQTQ